MSKKLAKQVRRTSKHVRKTSKKVRKTSKKVSRKSMKGGSKKVRRTSMKKRSKSGSRKRNQKAGGGPGACVALRYIPPGGTGTQVIRICDNDDLPYISANASSEASAIVREFPVKLATALRDPAQGKGKKLETAFKIDVGPEVFDFIKRLREGGVLKNEFKSLPISTS